MWQQPVELDQLFGVKCAVLRFLKHRGYDIDASESRYAGAPCSESQILPHNIDDIDPSEYCVVSYQTYDMRKEIFASYRTFMEAATRIPSDNISIDGTYPHKTRTVGQPIQQVDKILVRYLPAVDESVETKMIKALTAEIGSKRPFNVLLVSNGKISSSNMTDLRTQCPGVKLEIYSEQELIIMVSGHALQPNYFTTSEESKRAIVRAAGVKKEAHMPKVLSSDPVVVLNEWQKGQMVKYFRHNDPYNTCVEANIYGRIVS